PMVRYNTKVASRGRSMCRGLVLFALLAASLSAADPSCPAYPREERQAHLLRLDIERSAQALRAQSEKSPLPRAAASVNFIDDFIFGKMAADGVGAAPVSTDAEFLRRVMLDITGRIPKPDQVEAFLNDSNPGKRSALIDSLIASEAFVDNWTLFFGNLFQV